MCDLPKEVKEGLDELQEHYTDFRENKRGANGYLFFAVNKISCQEVAIKFYCGEEGGHQHDEPRQLAAINSPNVLPILDARKVGEDWGYFVTPKCNEGDLDDVIASFPSAHHALDISLGICNGVSALHAARMLHRDLKPANIVIDNGRPRIADFGSVIALADGIDFVVASKHSILYRPPESFATDRYTFKGDVYQVGLLVYQLLGGYLPYDGLKYLNRKQLTEYNLLDDPVDRAIYIDSVIQEKIESGTIIKLSTLPPWITSSSKRLLKYIINPDVEKRLPTIAEVAAVLTQIRSNVLDWKFVNGIPTLYIDDSIIQVRQSRNGEFAAYKKKGSGNFRMIPHMKSRCIVELINKIK